MASHQIWLRGAAYTRLSESKEEQTGVAVYASEYMCRQFEEQPMFIIPLDCTSIADLVAYGTYDVIRLGITPVPLTAKTEEE